MIKENMLTFIHEIDRRDRDKSKMALYQCSCENKTLVELSIIRVNRNAVKSCGCLKSSKNRSQRFIRHGMTKSTEYIIYLGIKARCLNKNSDSYGDYGGRGITICDRWLECFENFYADMGDRPSMEYSIHRVDNDGNYEPGNCIWATIDVQANRKRNNRILPFNGESLTISEWSKKTGLPRSTIKNRLRLLHWSIEKTLTTPKLVNQYSKGHVKYV